MTYFLFYPGQGRNSPVDAGWQAFFDSQFHLIASRLMLVGAGDKLPPSPRLRRTRKLELQTVRSNRVKSVSTADPADSRGHLAVPLFALLVSRQHIVAQAPQIVQ